MVTYMSHPVHGRMPCSPHEIEWNKKHGWQIEEIISKPKNELSVSEQYEKKFGKPPHHRMSEKTIQEKLME